MKFDDCGTFLSRIFIFSVLLFSVLPLCHVHGQTVIKIGGLFPFTGPIADGPTFATAARYATDEINANPDILPNVTLELFIADDGSTQTGGVRGALDLDSQGVVAFVGAAASSVSVFVQFFAQIFNIPQISYASTSPALSDRKQYPLFSRVVPSDSVQGSAFALIIQQFGWPEAALVVSDDTYGRGGEQAFRDKCLELGIPILSTRIIPATATDAQIAQQLTLLRDTKARVIVSFMLAGQGYNIFRQAALLNMLPRDGYVWLGADGLMQSLVFTNSTSGQVDPLVRDGLSGFIGLTPSAGSGPTYDAFLDRWAALDTATYPGAGNRAIPFYATFAYDSVYLVARALDANIRSNLSTTGTDLYNTMLLANFTGVTGQVQLSSTGDRAYPVYDFLNLRPGIDAFTVVGSWTATRNLTTTTAIIWPDGTTNVPIIDSVLNPPPVPPTLDTVDYDDPVVIVLIILLSLLAIVTALIALALLFLLRTPVIKDSNIVYNYVLLASIFIACFVVYPYFHEADAALCGLRPWMTIAWFLVYGNMVAKLYYILYSWRNQESRKVAFVPKYRLKFYIYLAIFNAVVLGLELLLLIIWEAVAIPEPHRIDTLNGSNEETKVCRGYSDAAHYVFIALQCAYAGLLMFAGLLASFPGYFAPVFWLEARYLSIAVVLCTFASIGMIIPAFILQNVPEAWISLIGFGILICLCLALSVVFLPKFYYVFFSKANRQSILFLSCADEDSLHEPKTPRRKSTARPARDIFGPAGDGITDTGLDDGLDDL